MDLSFIFFFSSRLDLLFSTNEHIPTVAPHPTNIPLPKIIPISFGTPPTLLAAVVII